MVWCFMKVHFLTQLTFFGNSLVVRHEQYVSFHGRASRCGIESPFEPVAVLSRDSSSDALHIVRSGRMIPAVSCPAGHLVLSQVVRDALGWVRNVEFRPVVFDKLVDVSAPKGDFSNYQSDPYVSIEQKLKELPDSRERFGDPGTFYELITNVNNDIASQFVPTTPLVTPIGPTEFDEPVECRLSEALVREFPLHWCYGAYMFSEKAFDAIEPHVDWDFFLHAEVDF